MRHEPLQAGGRIHRRKDLQARSMVVTINTASNAKSCRHDGAAIRSGVAEMRERFLACSHAVRTCSVVARRKPTE